MLFLVFTDRHTISKDDEDIRRHQNRVGEQPGVGLETLADLVLVAVAFLQQRHRRDVGQDPGQLGYLWQVALAVEDRALRIESAGQKIECDIAGMGAQLVCTVNRG